MKNLTRRGFNLICGAAAITEALRTAMPNLSFAAESADAGALTSLTLTQASERIHNRTVTSTQLGEGASRSHQHL